MAANPRAVMRALKAAAPAPSMGGYGNHPAPYIGPGPSPLVASYNEWGGAHQYGTNASLPRDWNTFLSGMFGPLAPIQPVPIDIPPPGSERPEPRRWQYPVGFDMPMGMPGTEGIGKLADFQTLRTICDLYSVARSAINLRKNELRGLGWDIAPTTAAAKAMRGDHKAVADFAERQAKVLKFFLRPDPNYSDFSSWFFALLEEFFVTDAISLYIHPSRMRGKGVMGSNLAALDALDGSLIRPMLDVRGGRPAPPSPAFQQMEYGVPRVDLMTMLAGEDIDPDSGLVAEYRGDQLMYLPYSPRVWSPYGQAWIENALVPALTGIQKQAFQANYFSEGTVPAAYISPGDATLTPSQLRELQDALNALAGDQAWKHKIIVLPGGSKVDPQKPGPLADDFDTLIQLQTVMGFDVQPFELGILPQLSAAASSSGAARQIVGASVDIRQRKSTVPVLMFFKTAVFDPIIQNVFHQADMHWAWEGMQEEPDAEKLTPMLAQQIETGMASVDEARQILGREPWGLPITSDPGWATQWGGLVPLTGVTEATAQPLGGSPGPGGAGRGSGMSSTLTLPGGTPTAGGPAAPGTVPRNRLSSGKRREQARQITTTQNRTGSTGTPAHSGARSAAASRAPRASATPRQRGASKDAVRKAVEDALGSATAAQARHALAPPGDPARELGLLRSHLKRGGDVWSWQPRGIPAHVMARIAGDLGRGASVDEAIGAARGLVKSTPDPVPDGTPVSADVVRRQLSRNFPPEAISWVRDARWALADVPVADIDESDVDSWAAHHEHDRVAHFARRVEEGERVNPPVMVRVPGKRRVRVVDGHHRTLGSQAAHLTHVRAYVGTVPAGDDRWIETHSYQEHQGNSPLNKRKAGELPKAAGILVRAADTGRVLMIQRGMEGPDDDDNWAGFWEIPGGRLEPGESALDAARREWAEEVGVRPPAGEIDGLWNSGNGKYRGHVLTVPSEDAVDLFGDRDEVDNPDSGLLEALAWWDPGQIKGNPAVREELRDDFKRIKRALKKGAARGTPGLTSRSGMISLDVPAGVVKPVRGGVSDHHITVVYLGPDVDDEAFAAACRRALEACGAVDGPLGGVLSGVGSFPPSASSDGKRPVFLHARVPGAEKLRAALEDLSASEHKDWKPHMTLAYLDEGERLPPDPGVAPLTFTHLSVHRGAEVRRFPLGGVTKSAETASLAATHNPLGSHSLWHTPDKHVSYRQSLPNYIEGVAHGLERAGHDEQTAIRMAVAAVKRWSKGGPHVHPEVQRASQHALAEWRKLKASHH